MTTLKNHTGPFVNEQEELLAFTLWNLHHLQVWMKWVRRSDKPLEEALLEAGVEDCFCKALERMPELPWLGSNTDIIQKLKQHQKKDYKERSDNVEKARALIQIQFESLVIEGEDYQAEFIASGAMKFIMVAKERTKLIVSRLIANT